MNLNDKKIIKEYNEIIHSLEILKQFVLEFLKSKIYEEHKIFVAGVEGRIKTEQSLSEKIKLKGSKYNSIFDITDLFGARIITFYNDEVDIISSIIQKYFMVDYELSIDKRKLHEVDRFGYMSLHYVCKIPKSLFHDENNSILNDIYFEIQIRTCLQHVWATIFHDTGYKSDIEVPKEYIRKLARLEGLLELADDEFYTIRNEIDNYRAKIRTLVSKGKFEDISLNIDSYKNYLSLDPYRKLIKKIAEINKAEVEEVDYLRFYELFIDYGFSTLGEIEKMRIDNSEDAYKLSLKQLSGTGIDIISSTIALHNLFVVYLIKKGGGVKDIKNLLSKIQVKNKISDRVVEKIVEQAKTIVLI